MTEYALSKFLPLNFDEAVARLPEALASEGFGVLTQIDVTNVFAQKLQVPLIAELARDVVGRLERVFAKLS